jgi:hypothetical protein
VGNGERDLGFEAEAPPMPLAAVNDARRTKEYKSSVPRHRIYVMPRFNCSVDHFPRLDVRRRVARNRNKEASGVKKEERKKDSQAKRREG